MKTIEEIKSEIESLASQKRDEMTDKEFNRTNKRIRFLNLCVMFIERGATEAFLKKRGCQAE